MPDNDTVGYDCSVRPHAEREEYIRAGVRHRVPDLPNYDPFSFGNPGKPGGLDQIPSIRGFSRTWQVVRAKKKERPEHAESEEEVLCWCILSCGGMAIYHFGQRDDRRRRVLSETSLGGGPPAATPRKRRSSKGWLGKSKNYGDAEFLDQQPRLTDLMPTRILPIAAWFALGLVCLMGLNVVHTGVAGVASPGGLRRIVAFDLAAQGSLATWFSSLLLLLAALAAIVVYTIRRHKNDDYRGRYRIWGWAAFCWTLMSVVEVSHLHEAFRDLMVGLCGTPLLGDGSVWWLILGLFLFGSVGLRLLVDMHGCRWAFTAMLLAGLCYALALSTHFGVVVAGEEQVLVVANAKMAGHLLLLLAIVLYGRHVILDAQGLITREEAQPKKKPAKKAGRELVLSRQRGPEGSSAAWRDSETGRTTNLPARRVRRRGIRESGGLRRYGRARPARCGVSLDACAGSPFGRKPRPAEAYQGTARR